MATAFRPVQRLLHTTCAHPARLIGSHLSLSPDFANAPPPPAPVAPPIARADLSRPPRSEPRSAAQPPAAPPKAEPAPPRPSRAPSATPRRTADDGRQRLIGLDSTAPHGRAGAHSQGNAAAQESPEALSAAALEAHLLRTLAQLHEKRHRQRLGAEVGLGAESGTDAATAAPATVANWLDLPTLAQQRRDREGHVVKDVTVEYEPTPGPSRRLRLDGRTGVQEDADAVVHEAPEEQDGIVIVAHVLGGVNPRVSICSGFAVGRADHAVPAGRGQAILTCAHTLDSVRRSRTMRCVADDPTR